MAEKKISELSIGDWVRHTFYEENLQIKRIDGESERMLVEKGLMSVSCHLDHFEPIPLTPEILEKNGFVKSSEYRWSNPSIGCACLRLGTKYWDIRIVGRNRAYRPTRISIDNIVHTHQLQHALRLAGVEKEIEV